MVKILEMAIGNLFVSVVAIRLFGVIKSKVRYLNVAIFGFLWLYTTTLYVLILGVLGLLESHRIAAISGIGLIIFAVPTLRDFRNHVKTVHKWFKSLYRVFSSFRVHLPEFPNLQHHSSGFMSFVLCLLAFLQLARIVFHIWFVPPYVWDTVVYHLVNVAEWIQKGKIHPVISPVGRVYWPANFEVLETWFVVFLYNDLLIKVGSFLFYIVAGASAYAIARTLSLNRILSASAAIFYLFTPSLAVQATACKNDVAIAAIYLLMIAILLDLFKNGSSDFSRNRQKILILIMAFCLGLGTKPYIVFILPAPLLIGLAVILKHRSRIDIRFFFHSNKLSTCVILVFVCLILGSIFLGSYWYIRNLVVFDNPFHPTDFRVFGHLVFGTGDAVQYGPGQRGSASLEALKENLWSLITDKIFDQHGYFDSSLGNISGWGWFNFVCGISALGYALIFVGHLRLLIVSFIISLLGLFTFISVDPWYMRFTLWFPVVFALSFVYLISNLSYKWLKIPLMALALVCTVFNWIAVLNVGEISVNDFKRMMELPPLKRSTAELTHHYSGAYRKTLKIVPKHEIIGYCFPNNGWAYPLYDSDFSRRLKYVPVENMQFIEFMKEQNIHYLFVERISPEQTELIKKAVQEGFLKKIEDFLYAFKKS